MTFKPFSKWFNDENIEFKSKIIKINYSYAIIIPRKIVAQNRDLIGKGRSITLRIVRCDKNESNNT